MKMLSDETRKRMSESAKKRCTPEWRMKKSELMSTKLDENLVRSMYEKGFTQDEIAKELNTSQKVVWRFMQKHGIKTRTAFKRNQVGEKNAYWKGDNALYGSFHQMVKYSRGTAKDYGCCVCGTKEISKWYDWANLTGDYGNVNDYAPMCRSCHRKYDKGLVVMLNVRETAKNA